jgi:alginate O-acetyltransferase complex protein AlgI
MLFTTATFVLLYLPLTLLGFFLLGRRSPSAAAGWLFLASLFFYGYWMPQFTLLLLLSIGMNFWVGLRILKALAGAGSGTGAKPAPAKRWLVAGVVFNLGLLAYFKYANFFVDNLEWLAGTQWNLPRVILPIGISFYCFTQIAFLVDTARGKVREANFIHYGLFVTYFPHLIAGPVLHHAQMMPQFDDRAIYAPRTGYLVAGLAIFLVGLLKKVVLADGISPYADAVFQPADAGSMPSTAEAWIAAVAYTLQLYFDFSGYSDMAIGLSWMFNVRLPFNFDSPYRATSISDFWRRWHISLSNFLRDYLYIALGGNRHGALRRHANLLTTMLLGGLWHGASWSFVIWGGLHGAYLVINHTFRAAMGPAVCALLDGSRAWKLFAWGLTMLTVVVGWVFFRAQTLGGAMRMLDAMAGQAQAGLSGMPLFWNAGLQPSAALVWCAVLGAVATLLPNSNWLGARVLAWCETPSVLRAALGTACLLSVLFLVVVNAARDSVSAFIYFNF